MDSILLKYRPDSNNQDGNGGTESAAVAFKTKTFDNQRAESGLFSQFEQSILIKETIMGKKTALFIIDMQNDFVLPGAVMCVSGAQRTIPAIQKLLSVARKNGWSIFFIIREHDSSGNDVEPYRKPFFEGGKGGFCVPGTEGCKIVSGLEVKKGDTVFVKKRNSAFFMTNLHEILQKNGVGTIVVAGTQYPNCIRGTSCDAMSYGYRTIVCTDACSAQTRETAEANIRDMQNMGIECVPLSQIERMAF